jgi:hypothetical protein
VVGVGVGVAVAVGETVVLVAPVVVVPVVPVVPVVVEVVPVVVEPTEATVAVVPGCVIAASQPSPVVAAAPARAVPIVMLRRRRSARVRALVRCRVEVSMTRWWSAFL